MNATRTLSLYVAREILLFSSLGFAAVGLVLAGDQLLARLGELVSVGMTPREIGSVLASIALVIATPALPLAFAFGSLLAILRLASDSEITAIRACGISPVRLLRPALAVGLGVSALTAWLVLDREPAARLSMRNTFTRVAMRGAVIQTGKVRGVADRMVYVDDRSRDNQLRGVVIYDGSDPERSFVVVAPEGRLIANEDAQQLTLALDRGEIHLDPDGENPEQATLIAFDRLDYTIGAADLLHTKAWRRKPEELSLTEIGATIDEIDAGHTPIGMREWKRSLYSTELHRRFALIPVPLLFALLAVPLGVVLRRGRRSLGVLLCGVVTAGYYALQGAARGLGEDGVVSPMLACWTPNALLLALALALLARSARGFVR